MSWMMIRATLVATILIVAITTTHLLGAGPQDEDEPRLDKKGHRLPPYATARLGAVRMFSGGSISALACSPDSRFVASAASNSSNVWLWDLDTQELERVFLGGPHGIGSLDFSPDGKLLAAGSSPGSSIAIWEVASGAMRHKIRTDAQAPTGPVPVKFLQKRRELVTYDSGGMVQVWNQDFGSEVRRFPDGVERSRSAPYLYQAMDVSPDDQWLALACADGRVRLYDILGDAEPRVFGEGEVLIHSLRFIPGSPFFAWAASPRVHFNFDEEGEKKLRLQPGVGTFFQHRDEEKPKLAFSFVPEWRTSSPGFAGVMATSPDGKWIAVAPQRGPVQVWSTGEDRKEPRLLGNPATVLTFTPDSEVLVVGGGLVQCFNLKTGLELYPQQEIELPGRRAVAFTEDDQSIVTIRSSGRNEICRWSTATGEVASVVPYETSGEIRETTYQGNDLRKVDPNGTFAGLLDGPGIKLVADATYTGESWLGLEPPPLPEGAQHPYSKLLAISADGSTVVCRTYVRVLKLEERRQEYLYTLRVIDLKTGKLRCELPIDYEMHTVALNHDGSRLAYAQRRDPKANAAAVGDEDVYLFDVDAQEEGSKKELWKSKDVTIASTPYFTPDGKFIATDPYYDQIIRFLETATGRVAFQIVGPHGGSWQDPVISADGARAALITGENLVDVFDVKSGELTHRFRQPVEKIVLSHDGQRMLIVQEDLTVLVVDLSSGVSDLEADRKMATDENLVQAWITMSPLDTPTGGTIDAFDVLAFGGERTVKLARERIFDHPELDARDLDGWFTKLQSQDDRQRCEMVQQLMPSLGSLEELKLARRGPLTSQQLNALRALISKVSSSRLRDVVEIMYSIGSPDAKQVVEQINAQPRVDARVRKKATEVLKTWNISRSLDTWTERQKQPKPALQF